MKVLLVVMLAVGLFVSGYSVVSYGRSDVKFISVMSEVTDLAGEGDKQAENVANRIEEDLTTVRSYFGVLAMAGLGLVCLSVICLIVESKRIDRSGENEIAGYKLARGSVKSV